MTPPIKASRVQPNQLKKVAAGDQVSQSQENVIRDFVREQSVTDPLVGGDWGPIRFMRCTEKDKKSCEAVLLFNDAPAGSPPNFVDSNQVAENVWDILDVLDEDQVFQAVYYSRDDLWVPLGGCEEESSSSDSNSSSGSSSGGCKLDNCCNYWGAVTEVDDDGNVTKANVYDHAGGFIAEIDELLDWVECELLVGDIVAIDTDYECYPKILMDPCLAVRRACGSSSDAGGDSSGE